MHSFSSDGEIPEKFPLQECKKVTANENNKTK
jgi:hypothetical protein